MARCNPPFLPWIAAIDIKYSYITFIVTPRIEGTAITPRPKKPLTETYLQDIAELMCAGLRPSDTNDKLCIFTAGATGSGKSYVSNQIQERALQDSYGERNLDEFVEVLINKMKRGHVLYDLRDKFSDLMIKYGLRTKKWESNSGRNAEFIARLQKLIPEFKAVPIEKNIAWVDFDVGGSLLPEARKLRSEGTLDTIPRLYSEAWKITIATAEKAMEGGLPVVVDTTFSRLPRTAEDQPSDCERLLESSASHGYSPKVVMATAPLSEIFQRDLARADKIGRMIPTQNILVSHSKPSKNLPTLLEILERVNGGLLLIESDSANQAFHPVATMAGTKMPDESSEFLNTISSALTGRDIKDELKQSQHQSAELQIIDHARFEAFEAKGTLTPSILEHRNYKRHLECKGPIDSVQLTIPEEHTLFSAFIPAMIEHARHYESMLAMSHASQTGISV